MCLASRRGELFPALWLGVPNGRDHWENIGGHEKITLIYTFWK